MSKMSELDATLGELQDAAAVINAAVETLVEMFGKTETAEKAPIKEAPRQMTLQEIRAILAEKSRNGHRNDVRELLLKYGSDKLSGIDPDKYSALAAETEEWKDAT